MKDEDIKELEQIIDSPKTLKAVIDMSPAVSTSNEPPLRKCNCSQTPKNEIELKELAEEDFNYSRNNLHKIIDSGVTSLEMLALYARDSTTPKMHEVVGTLMKNIADTTKELFELHQKMKNLNSDDTEKNKSNSRGSKGDTNITNNIITTTNDVLNIIKTQLSKK